MNSRPGNRRWRLVAAIVVVVVIGPAIWFHSGTIADAPELALVADEDASNEAIVAVGTLILIDQCLMLEQDNGDLVGLAFRGSDVDWSSEENILSHRHTNTGRQTFHPGDRVSIGGGGPAKNYDDLDLIRATNCSGIARYVHVHSINKEPAG